MVSLIFVAYLMLEVGCEAQAFTLCLQGRGGAQLEWTISLLLAGRSSSPQVARRISNL